jgi:hypothetical protein
MNIVQNVAEFRQMISRAKATGSGFGTNLFLADSVLDGLVSTGKLFAQESEGAVIFLRRETSYDRVYYAVAHLSCLAVALSRLTSGNVLASSLVGRKDEVAPWAAEYASAGFSHTTTLLRAQLAQTGQAPAEGVEADSGIEVARIEDAEEIHAALLANFDVYEDQIPSLEEIREAAASGTILLVREEDRIAALHYYIRTGLTSRSRYWLVLPEYRTRGTNKTIARSTYGYRLFRRYLNDCLGCRRSIVWVNERNSRARQIYSWYGYKEDSIVDMVMIKRR